MTPDFHGLISQMAAELDHCQQLLRDDRRQRHPLADCARALLDQPAPPAEGEVAELVEWLRRICFDVAPCDADALTRAADLLAQTEPERSASMDYARQCNTQAVAALVALEALADAADQFGPTGGADGKALAAEVEKARGFLARALLAEADGREPASVALQPSDGELLATLNQAVADFPPRHPEAEAMNAVEYSLALELRKARAVLDRWGHHPAPPAEGDVAEVAAWLRLFCSEEYESRSLDPDVAWLTRAAELLEQHQPAPVPVSERLPSAADCDVEDNCWWFDPHADGAWYVDTFQSCYTHWLPANALPTPEATNA